jgi:hypothetical protein
MAPVNSLGPYPKELNGSRNSFATPAIPIVYFTPTAHLIYSLADKDRYEITCAS